MIPFNRPSTTGNESRYIEKAIANGHLSGCGPFTIQVQALLEKELGATKVLLTTSCTHALEMTALLLDLRAGDEVILPSYTFVSTANAYVLRGATPVFADIRRDTLNLDETQLPELVTSKTKVIVPVHYAGVGCEMDVIENIAREHDISIVEDNAHGLFGKYRGKMLGGFGALSTLSFHETKNFSCGEGGALILNKTDFVERAEIIRDKGTNRSRFFRGQVDKYTWVDVGSSYPLSDLLAAYLLAQLEHRKQIQDYRQKLWERYKSALERWSLLNGILLPNIPDHCAQAFHMFYLILPNLDLRARFIQHLKARHILSVFHYLPLHLSDMGRRFGGRIGQCPITENISECLARLPLYNSMEECEQDRVIEAVLEFSP